MKTNKFIIILLLLNATVSGLGQKTYLNYPFYRDGIRIVGNSYYYMGRSDIAAKYGSNLNLVYDGVSIGLVINPHFNYGIGMNLGIQYFEFSLIHIKKLGGNVYYGVETGVNITPHLDFKIPFSNDLALGTHTGLGVSLNPLCWRFAKDNTIVLGGLKDASTLVDVYYGLTIYLEHIRYRWELSWNLGLTDHYGRFPRQNKIMVGIVYFAFK